MTDPKVKDLLKCKTKKQVIAYAQKKRCRVVEGKGYVYVDNIKCTFNHSDKLLFVE